MIPLNFHRVILTFAQYHRFSKKVHISIDLNSWEKHTIIPRPKMLHQQYLTFATPHILIGLFPYIHDPLRQLPNYLLIDSIK